MQLKIHSLQDRIAAYNVLREERNEESARLRAVMMKCLESLQAEALMSGQGSLTHPLSVSELPSSVLLEGLQKKMTEVAIAIKLKYGASSVESSESCFDTPLGHSGRRINKLSTREVSVRGRSVIVRLYFRLTNSPCVFERRKLSWVRETPQDRRYPPFWSPFSLRQSKQRSP